MNETKASDVQDDLTGPRIHMRPRTAVAMVVAGIVIGIGGYRLVTALPGAPARAQATAPQLRVSTFVKDGPRITVPEGSPLRAKLTVAAVEDRDIQRALTIPAVVEADPARLVKILPPVAGRITELKVQLGQRIKAGQALVVIDSSDLALAYSDYDRAKVLLSLALKNRDRLRSLEKIGGAALKDQQQAETDYVTAEVEYQRADARLRQIGVSSESTDKSRLVTVTAPAAGSVIDLAVATGAYWNDTTAALMTVADLSTVWVTANVAEKDTALVTNGQSVDVTFAAYPGEGLKGEVLFVSDILDPDTRRAKVRIAFQNPNTRLKPNMFATATFATPMRRMAVVPTTALILKDDADQVFVEVAPWTFEPRRVDIGFQQGDNSIVQDGLKAGDRVVVKGGVLLND